MKILDKIDDLIEKANRCWEGYKPVAGKKPYSDGSCEPAKKGDPWGSDSQANKLDSRKQNATTRAKETQPKVPSAPSSNPGELVFDTPPMPKREPVKKDDKAHKPGSPADSAHDAIENDTWDKEEKGRSASFKQKMGDHARSMVDPKKQRDRESREAGKDDKGTKEMKKSADTIDRLIAAAEELEKAVKKSSAKKTEIQGASHDKATGVTTFTYGKKPKADESKAPTMDYSQMSMPKPKREVNEQRLHARVSAARTPGVYKKELHKSETRSVPMTAEELTNLVKSERSHGDVAAWLDQACEQGRIHRNVTLEWHNFGTLHPSVYALLTSEEE